MVGRKKSLSSRLLVMTAVVLIAAFAATLLLLDAIFRTTSEAAIKDLLEVQVLALVSVAEPGPRGGLAFPGQLPESRLSSMESGLFAEILDARGARIWRSPSTTGVALAEGLSVRPGERLYQRRMLADGKEVLVLGVGLNWELTSNVSRVFQVFVGEDLSAYERELSRLRRQLTGWFGGVILCLLFGIWLLLRLGLAPLRRMADEISAIESGDGEMLSENYPRELHGVARSMNALVKSERQRMSRFRTTMDDLAHSLKTPLAVLRSEIDKQKPDTETLQTQLGRMQGVIDYQLRRAAAAGPRTFAASPVPIAPICAELAGSLRKIYRDKTVQCEIRVPMDMRYPAEQGDLYESVGNLLDNAWKWCNGRITVDASIKAGTKKSESDEFIFAVSDDGPGVPDGHNEAMLDRGNRAEPRGDVPGQGIGLAVVAEIADLYRGSVSIGRSEMGGARVELRLPL
jgi:two-component system sensor histidine kinase PhoQ